MPLYTDDIAAARQAFSVLEARTSAVEQRAEQLDATVAQLRARLPPLEQDSAQLRQRIAAVEAENVSLRAEVERLTRLQTELSLENLIESFGLAAAVGEASMPDRTIASLAATLQTHLVPRDGGLGIRFQPPELGAVAAGLSSTAFEIVKVPPPGGVAAPRHLYVVLHDKQRVYGDPFWVRFAPAARLAAACGAILNSTGGWSFPFLVRSAATIAALELELAPSVAQALPGEADAFRASVEALASLTNTLAGKARPVAGDLFALSAALDATTGAPLTVLS